MRDANGVPQEIGDLSPDPGENRPYSSEPAHGPGCTIDDHLRALAAFVAQLRDKVAELEAR